MFGALECAQIFVLFCIIFRTDIKLVMSCTKVMLLGILCLTYGFSECTTAVTPTIVSWYAVLIKKNLNTTKDKIS